MKYMLPLVLVAAAATAYAQTTPRASTDTLTRAAEPTDAKLEKLDRSHADYFRFRTEKSAVRALKNVVSV